MTLRKDRRRNTTPGLITPKNRAQPQTKPHNRHIQTASHDTAPITTLRHDNKIRRHAQRHIDTTTSETPYDTTRQHDTTSHDISRKTDDTKPNSLRGGATLTVVLCNSSMETYVLDLQQQETFQNIVLDLLKSRESFARRRVQSILECEEVAHPSKRGQWTPQPLQHRKILPQPNLLLAKRSSKGDRRYHLTLGIRRLPVNATSFKFHDAWSTKTGRWVRLEFSWDLPIKESLKNLPRTCRESAENPQNLPRTHREAAEPNMISTKNQPRIHEKL